MTVLVILMLLLMSVSGMFVRSDDGQLPQDTNFGRANLTSESVGTPLSNTSSVWQRSKRSPKWCTTDSDCPSNVTCAVEENECKCDPDGAESDKYGVACVEAMSHESHHEDLIKWFFGLFSIITLLVIGIPCAILIIIPCVYLCCMWYAMRQQAQRPRWFPGHVNTPTDGTTTPTGYSPPYPVQQAVPYPPQAPYNPY